MHLFADNKYRLRVNGAIVAYGPARFIPNSPEYDTVDIASYLKIGSNLIIVEAQRSDFSFQAIEHRAGFIAWGQIGSGINLATPGQWTCCAGEAWDDLAPWFTFAQAPLEIFDGRKLPARALSNFSKGRAWKAPVVAPKPAPWGKLRPRSIPPLTNEIRLPDRVVTIAPVSTAEYRMAFRADGVPSDCRKKRRYTCFVAHIFSPEEQVLKLGVFWGVHYINGARISFLKEEEIGLRKDVPLPLRKGWNLLYAEEEIMEQGWATHMAVPREPGLLVCSTPDHSDPAIMMRTESISEEELKQARIRIPATLDELPRFSTQWTKVGRDGLSRMPAREIHWDKLGPAIAHDAFAVRNIVMPLGDDGSATAVFDFGGEYLGHVIVELESPAGTVVDVGYDERLRPDGSLAMYQTHWRVHTADGFIARGGVDRWESYYSRAGRYLQITVRHARGPVTLRLAAVRQSTYPLRVEGSFECSHQFYNWLWVAASATIQACMEDAFLDCPWRERGCYLGDMLVQYASCRLLSSDSRLTRRCLELWALSQKPDGQMYDVTPSCHEESLVDYSLIWIVLLRDYWLATGDRAFVAQVWSHVGRVLSSSVWQEGKSGLWSADGIKVFCDWSVPAEAVRGESGPLNGFRYGALRAAEELASGLHRGPEATAFRREAARVRSALRERLWNAHRGSYADSWSGDGLSIGPALHTNVLALYFGFAREEDAPRIWRAIEPFLRRNHLREKGYLETYFFYYLLGALAKYQMSDLAESLILSNYRGHRAAGAWTLWEGFTGASSFCHAWSNGPMVYLSEHILGVQRDGQDGLLIAPQSGDVAFARGVFPHMAGPVRVSWRRDEGGLNLEIEAPAGLKIKVKPAGALAHVPCRFTIRRFVSRGAAR